MTEIKLGQMYASLCNSAQRTSGATGDKTEQMDDRDRIGTEGSITVEFTTEDNRRGAYR